MHQQSEMQQPWHFIHDPLIYQGALNKDQRGNMQYAHSIDEQQTSQGAPNMD